MKSLVIFFKDYRRFTFIVSSILSFVLTFLTLIIFNIYRDYEPTFDLYLNADIPVQGGSVEIYVNDNNSTPFHFNLTAGKPEKLIARNIPASIFKIRLDPVDYAGVTLKINEFSIRTSDKYRPAPSRKIIEFTQRDMKEWALGSLVWQVASGELLSTADGPTMLTAFSPPINLISKLENEPGAPLVVTIPLFTLLVLSFLSGVVLFINLKAVIKNKFSLISQPIKNWFTGTVLFINLKSMINNLKSMIQTFPPSSSCRNREKYSKLMEHESTKNEITFVWLFSILSVGTSFLLSISWGFFRNIVWFNSAHIDRDLLLSDPIRSLVCLHSQPPIANIFLAISANISQRTLVSDSFFLCVLFFSIAVPGMFCLISVLKAFTTHRKAPYVAALIFIFTPCYLRYSFDTDFIYTFVTSNLLAIFLYFALRYIRTESLKYFICSGFILILIALTRTLYVPFFLLLVYGVLATLNLIQNGPRTNSTILKHALIIIIFGILVNIWPMKNFVIYDHFVTSSWSGFNLNWRTPKASEINRLLGGYLINGHVPEEVMQKRENYALYCQKSELITRAMPRSNGVMSMHHYIYMETQQELTEIGIQWRIENFASWLGLSAAQYLMAMRPGFIFPYGDGTGIFAPNWPPYIRYAKAIQDILFIDLRPIIETTFPNAEIHTIALIRGQKVPYTLFGLLLFPAIVLISLGLSLKYLPRSAEGSILLLSSIFVVWNVAIPSLTDGFESNRMRMETLSAFAVMTFATICFFTTCFQRLSIFVLQYFQRLLL